MSTLRKTIFTLILATLLLIGSTTYAAEEAQQTEIQEDPDFTEKVKNGAAKVGEVAGELWDNTKAGFGEVTDKFKGWRRSQEDEFWERTDEQLNNEGAAENSADGSSEPEASETPTESGTEDGNGEAGTTATEPQEASEAVETSSAEKSEAASSTATEPETGAEAETAKEKAKNEPDSDRRKSWPLPVIALCIIGIGGAGALIYERWERWYKTPS